MVPKGNQSTLPTLRDGDRLTWAVRVVYWKSLASGDSINSVEYDAERSVCPLRPYWLLIQTRGTQNCKSWSLHMRENYTFIETDPKKPWEEKITPSLLVKWVEAGFKPWPEHVDGRVGDRALKDHSVRLQIDVPLLKTMKQVFAIKIKYRCNSSCFSRCLPLA